MRRLSRRKKLRKAKLETMGSASTSEVNGGKRALKKRKYA